MKEERLKQLRVAFKRIIKDLIDDSAGGRHTIGNTDIPLIIADKLVYEVKIRINNK